MDDPARAADCDRVLDAEGRPVADVPSLDDDELLGFYRTMVRNRVYEERVRRLRGDREIMLETGTRGEEATPLGSAAALQPGDWIFPSYRQRPAFFHWGWPMDRMLAERRGASRADMDAHLGKPGTPVEITPVAVAVGANIPQAVGFGMGCSYSGDDRVALAYVGDGTTSEGVVHEALNIAGVMEPPTVIVCQNNQWSKSTPADRQTAAETFAQKADAHGVPRKRVDGNDVLAVYEAAQSAVDRARDGGGPTFIEALTHRDGPHNTEDDDAYRDRVPASTDPVERFERFLRERGILDDDRAAAVRGEVAEQVDEAIDRGMDVPASPDPETVFDHHLSTDPWQHRRQRMELAAERRGDNPFEVDGP